jgi:hypothetical protein
MARDDIGYRQDQSMLSTGGHDEVYMGVPGDIEYELEQLSGRS